MANQIHSTQRSGAMCTFISVTPLSRSQWARSGNSECRHVRGVTLIEVLLVLAIIAAIAGMVMPSFESLISSRRLKNAAERIAMDMAEARVEAMKTGQSQVFRATIQGREYSFEPWLDSYDEVDASEGATISSSQTGMIVETESSTEVSSAAELEESDMTSELETGVQFSSVETLIDTRNAAAIESETGVVPTAGAAQTNGISSPILFYPDGSSTTAIVVLVDEAGRRMVVELRGVTGRISVYRTTSVDPSTFVADDSSFTSSP